MASRITVQSIAQKYHNVIAYILFFLSLLTGAATIFESNKFSDIAVYALFGIIILFSILGVLPKAIPSGFKLIMVITGLLILGFLTCYHVFTFPRQWSVIILVLDVILGVAAWQVQSKKQPWQERLLLPLFLTAAVPGLLWWLHHQPVLLWGALEQAALSLGIGGIVWLALAPQSAFKGRLPMALVLTVLAIPAFIASADMSGIASSVYTTNHLLHHWGAYQGAVADLQAGLVPFVDFPLQYGIGPTLFLDGLCHINGDCWFGMYWGVAILGAVYGLSLACSALLMAGKEGRSRFIGIILVSLGAVFCIAGNLFLGTVPVVTPGIGGLRFVPLTLLILALSANRIRLAGAIMFLATLWSIDMAAMCLVTFGGVMIARQGLLRGALMAGSMLVAAEVFLVLVHRLLTGEFMDPRVYLEYFSNIPGLMPMNPFGALSLLAGVVWLGVRLLQTSSKDPLERLRDVTAVCAMLASALYCVGRGHDDNVLNISPFMLLVAVRVFSRPSGSSKGLHSGLIRLPVASVRLAIASVAAIVGFAIWGSGHPFSAGGPSDYTALRPSIIAADSDLDAITQAIKNPEHLPVFIPNSIHRRMSETDVWTSLDPWHLFSFLPPDRLRVYVQRAAVRLKKSGWLVVPTDEIDWWEDNYAAAYDVTGKEEITFPGQPPLTAIRLAPKHLETEP